MAEIVHEAKRRSIRIDAGADFTDTLTVTSLSSLSDYQVHGRVDIVGRPSVEITTTVNGNVVTYALSSAQTATFPPVCQYIIWWVAPGSKVRGLLKGPIYTSQIRVGA